MNISIHRNNAMPLSFSLATIIPETDDNYPAFVTRGRHIPTIPQHLAVIGLVGMRLPLESLFDLRRRGNCRRAIVLIVVGGDAPDLAGRARRCWCRLPYFRGRARPLGAPLRDPHRGRSISLDSAVRFNRKDRKEHKERFFQQNEHHWIAHLLGEAPNVRASMNSLSVIFAFFAVQLRFWDRLDGAAPSATFPPPTARLPLPDSLSSRFSLPQILCSVRQSAFRPLSSALCLPSSAVSPPSSVLRILASVF